MAELHNKGLSLEAEAALVFIIECFTGVRWGEAAALTVADFDFDNNYIRINKTKSSKTGIISNTKSSQLRMSHGEDGERFVPFPKGLEPLFRDYVSSKKHALFSVSYSYCAEIQGRIKKSLTWNTLIRSLLGSLFLQTIVSWVLMSKIPRLC